VILIERRLNFFDVEIDKTAILAIVRNVVDQNSFVTGLERAK